MFAPYRIADTHTALKRPKNPQSLLAEKSLKNIPRPLKRTFIASSLVGGKESGAVYS